MATAPSYSESLPAQLTVGDLATLDQSLPFLRHLHDNTRIGKGLLPPDSPVFPGEHATLAPYYMGRLDTPGTNVWKIAVTGGIESRMSSWVNNNETMSYGFEVKDENGNYRHATSEESHELTTLIGYLNELGRTKAEAESPAKPSRINGLITRLGRLVTKTK